MNILIVEDEFLIAEDLKALLMELGHNVPVCAMTNGEALQSLDQALPDAAFVDTLLGPHSSERVVEECLRRGVPVVVASGHHPSLLPPYCQGLPFLPKPFSTADLTKILSALAVTQTSGT